MIIESTQDTKFFGRIRVTVPEAAKRLEVSQKTINRWSDKGHMPKRIKICGTVFFWLDEIEAWERADCPKNWPGQTENPNEE
ncbi:MAG: helix-turn-helix domain-containing protein [Planctomycetota bacterium]